MSFSIRLNYMTTDLPDGPGLVLRAPDPAGLSRLGDRIDCVQSFWPAAEKLRQAGVNLIGDVVPASYSKSLVCLTRSRDENRALIALGWQALGPGGLLLVDGPKTAGIDSLQREMAKRIGGIESLSKAHGKLLVATRSAADPFADWSDLAQSRQIECGHWTCAGIFSSDAPDPGSILLAQNLPKGLSGSAADFGAGWGWLSAAFLADQPEVISLDLIEAEGRALDCARRNVTDPRARFLHTDATDTHGAYDVIVMNPPFHTGRKTDPTLGQTFITAAARSLRPKGQLFLVANRQLPYEATLQALFSKVAKLTEDGAYKVLSAAVPKKRSHKPTR